MVGVGETAPRAVIGGDRVSDVGGIRCRDQRRDCVDWAVHSATKGERPRARRLDRVAQVLAIRQVGSAAHDEVAERLLALPGCGPYATAHMMMLLARYSRLVLDSWTRPKYARLRGRKASDKTIERRFRPYRDYAGLA